MGGWIQTWISVLTRPGEAVFAEERQRPEATLSTAVIWMAIAAVVSGVVTLISGFIFRNQIRSMGGWQGMLGQLGLSDEIMSQLDTSLIDTAIQTQSTWGIISGAIWAMGFLLIGFLIGVGILYLVARLFGGTGSYGRYAYLIAAFAAPLSIVSSLIGLVPMVGGCIVLLITVYEIVLAYFATKVEHNLSQGKAILVVILPVLLLVLLFFCVTIIIGGSIAALMNAGR